MEVFEAVRTLLAVRSYQSTPVPADAVRRIVEAGRLSASGMNAQPWHFIVIENPATLRALAGHARTGPYIAQAPLAIVVAIAQTPLAISDASRAIQSMLLTGWAEGLGSNWVGFSKLEPMKELLSIPTDLDVLAVLPFGYPASDIGKGKKQRKPLGEVTSRERFGQPYE
jgi:nitroreductase